MGRLDCDAAVIGGGPAGATAAMTLARFGYQVVLIEGSHYERPRVGETMPPSARPLLSRLGLWESFVALDSTPSFGNESAWGGSDLQSNSFIFSPYGNGWHLNRQRFDSFLADMATTAGATLIDSQQVIVSTLALRGSWRLTLRSRDGGTEEMRAHAIVEATGRLATVARRLGAKRHVYDNLVGVAVQYRGTPNTGGYTLIEATVDGWWYSAPVPPNRLIVMFMTDADLCRSQRRFKLEVWKRGLAQTEHTGARVSDYERVWGPKVFCAVSHRLERIEWVGRWLACGDAAMGVDPLSSSGILRALRGGEVAGQAMAHWLQGKPEAAHTYERWLDAEFADYWRERNAYYALETRWPNAPFWQRRLERATAA